MTSPTPSRSGRPFRRPTPTSAGWTWSSTTPATALVGTVEEASEADVRANFDTNYFGTLRVIQAALPLLRQQGGGHILGVSSSLGVVALPLIGFYCTTKWAVEALHESLAQEVKPFGIKVTLLEPGAYATDFGSPASLKVAPGMDAYAALRKGMSARLSTAERGDPQATSAAVLKVVDADNPPLRLLHRQHRLAHGACHVRRPIGHLGGVGGRLERGARRAAEGRRRPVLVPLTRGVSNQAADGVGGPRHRRDGHAAVAGHPDRLPARRPREGRATWPAGGRWIPWAAGSTPNPPPVSHR